MEELENTLAQSLMVHGLYTASFELLAKFTLSRVEKYAQEWDTSLLPKAAKAAYAADSIFKFCGPILISKGIWTQEDVDTITRIRKRRNLFAHEGFQLLFETTFESVEQDLTSLDEMVKKVERWDIPDRIAKTPPLSVSFTIGPRLVTNFARHIASGLASGRLRVSVK